MRPVRKITAEEENFRAVPFVGANMQTFKVDPVEPEPVGTIVLMAFRVTGYDPDCDGSLMAKLDQIDNNGDETGWSPTHIGLSPDCELVVTLDEFKAIFSPKAS